MPNPRLFLPLGALLLALFVAACGSEEGLIPSDAAERLEGQVEQLEEDVEAGNCDNAANELTNLRETVDELGGAVQRDIVEGLSELLLRVENQLDQCEPADETPTTTTTDETTDETTTTTTETDETTTDETTTTTDETTDQTTTTTDGDDGEATIEPDTGSGPGSGGSGGGSGGTAPREQKGRG